MMNHVFRTRNFFQVPDGTLVSPFLNSKDSKSDLPFDLLDGFSIAAGIILGHRRSKIHIFPLVTQVTFVKTGKLRVKMKTAGDNSKPYCACITPGEGVLTKPGSFFQLINERSEPCEVLHIVSPAYVYDEGVYDDSVVLDENWLELDKYNWQLSRKLPTLKSVNKRRES
jgi:hypothetical protein